MTSYFGRGKRATEREREREREREEREEWKIIITERVRGPM